MIGTTALPYTLRVWDMAARLSLPWWLYLWLGLLVATFLASLRFVGRHPAARWAIGGFVVSHALVAFIELAGPFTLRFGIVSCTHLIGWTPALLRLRRELRPTAIGTGYGAWVRLMMLVITVAFVFDLRDAGMLIYYVLSGHPALG